MFRPAQSTEREPDGSYEDCRWASGVMLANAAEGRNVHPVGQKENEALRKASGDSMEGGSNIFDLEKGMRARYGWSGPIGEHSWTKVWSALTPGTGLVIDGHLNALNDHYNRWNRTRVPHDAYVQREDWQQRAWWMNPLAPASYAGEWITMGELRKFFEALPGGRFMSVKIGSRHARIEVRPGGTLPRRFRRYRPTATGWTFTPWLTRGFSADSGRRQWITFRGNRHELVEVADSQSAYNHDWLDVNAAGVTWTGEK